MPKTKIKPSRWYYVFAGTALVAGGAVFAFFLLNGLSGLTEGLTQIVVPGRHELILSETGRYTVFHEYRSVVENRVYSMPKVGLSGLQCDLAFEATGERVPLYGSIMNSTYSFGSRSGIAVLNFQIDAPGTYVFSAQYPSGKEGPEAVLSVSCGFAKDLLFTIIGALGIMFGTLGAAATIAVVTFVMRQKAMKQFMTTRTPSPAKIR